MIRKKIQSNIHFNDCSGAACIEKVVLIVGLSLTALTAVTLLGAAINAKFEERETIEIAAFQSGGGDLAFPSFGPEASSIPGAKSSKNISAGGTEVGGRIDRPGRPGRPGPTSSSKDPTRNGITGDEGSKTVIPEDPNWVP